MKPASLVKGSVVQASAVPRWSAEALPIPETRSLLPQPAPRVSAVGPVVATELERVREQARQEGYAQGQEQAVREAREAVQEHLLRLGRLITSMDKAWARERDRAEAMLSDFAFVSVRRLLGDALQDRSLAVAAVRGALAACKGQEGLVVEVHPEDVSATQWALEALPSNEKGATVSIVGNGAVAVGGCRIVSDEGVLDARLETQLAELRRALDAARRT